MVRQKGLKSQLSRYSKYRGYIEEFYRNGNPNSLTDLEQKFKNLNDAMQECIQIVQVYDAFMDEQSKGFEERLQKAVYGTDFIIQKLRQINREIFYMNYWWHHGLRVGDIRLILIN